MSSHIVRIKTTDDLPQNVEAVAEGEPGRVRILLRRGLNQEETVRELEAVFECLVRLFPVTP